MFTLDHRFLEGNMPLARWPLCDVLLAKNAAYNWFLLVPRVAGATELLDLSDEQQQQLLRESNVLSRWIQAYFSPDKLNVAMLGNVVSSLHIHHVGRYRSDPAWPQPIWGHEAHQTYTDETLAKIRAAVTVLSQENFA